MLRRSFLAAIAAGTGASMGCSIFSTRTVVDSSRSLRLENGFFFGHDLRQEDSVVYVLDLSGSMSGRTGSVMEQVGKDTAAKAGSSLIGGMTGGVGSEAADSVLNMDKKVELVKDHLIASLRGLPAGAQFNVILFSNDVQRLAPTMVTANAASTNIVGAFVSRLKEGGSTSLKSAIMAGLDSQAKDLLVLTDGLPTDSTPDEILTTVKERNGNQAHRLSTVGVGDDQAKDFLTRLATENGGKYTAYS
jgi:VWA domain-containing protein